LHPERVRERERERERERGREREKEGSDKRRWQVPFMNGPD